MTNLRAGFLLALIGAVAGAACGSSSTTSTAPSTVPRCGVSVGASDMSVPANGGTGTVAISTARECAWTASSTAPWLTIRGSNSGQGDGTVDFVAAANPDTASRRATIELNDQKANVTQAGADCAIQLGDVSESFSLAGGSASFDVRASAPGCSWTALSDSSWIVIRSGASGTGNGQVTFDVGATTGGSRAGTVVVAGQTFAVTQSASATPAPACTFAVSPTSYAAGAAGGSTTVSVATAAGCQWTASSNVPWAAVTQGSPGTGAGSVQIVVEASGGADRSGTVLVAGQLVTVTQAQTAQACSFDVTPQNQSFGAQGGTGSASVSAPPGCGWTASSAVAWITVSPATGSGGGGINFTVAALTGAARSGTVNVAGTSFTVTQSTGCGFSLAPSGATVAASGGNGTVAITTASDCAWTASSNASWLTIGGGASGTGNGTVQFTAAATTSVSRSGTLTIGGQTFTVTQGSGCGFSLGSTSASAAASGATGSVTVTSGTGCPWTATAGVSWLTVTSGASGSGNGTVQYAAAANSGPARSGSLTIAGQSFTVNQANGCSFSIGSTSASAAASGGTGSVTVTSGTGCPWTATASASWLTVTAGASASGNGTVQYAVAANSGPARSGSLTIAGHSFAVNQASGCAYSINPSVGTIPGAGGTGNILVTAGPSCTWTAVSGVPWMTVTAGASGTGNGTVTFTSPGNPGSPRSGTIIIAGQTFTGNQTTGCTFQVSRTTINVNRALGSTESVRVSPNFEGCQWTASNDDVTWISVRPTVGTGTGTVEVVVAPNLGIDRRERITVAGQSILVIQDGLLNDKSVLPQ